MNTPAPPDGPAPPVSVVIPAWNRAATIRAAIESVLRQSWRDFELIVVDDASTDATLHEAAKIRDPRLRLVESPENRGAAGARNAGVAAARGTWVAFQDSDDEWLPRKLEKQMARLTAPGADFIAAYCGMLTLAGIDDRPGARPSLRYSPDHAIGRVEGDILRPLLWANMISTQTLVVRRDVFLDLGGLDETLAMIEDWDFALRLVQAGAVACVDEPLVLQRFSENSLTRDRARWLASRMAVVEKNRAAFARHPDRLARQYRMIAGGLRAAGDLEGARRYLGRALRAEPVNARAWVRAGQLAGLTLSRRLRGTPGGRVR